MDIYWCEATRDHRGRKSKWIGKGRKDMKKAIEQGKRWQRREPFAVIEIVSSNGMRATLEEMDKAQASRNAL